MASGAAVMHLAEPERRWRRLLTHAEERLAAARMCCSPLRERRLLRDTGDTETEKLRRREFVETEVVCLVWE